VLSEELQAELARGLPPLPADGTQYTIPELRQALASMGKSQFSPEYRQNVPTQASASASAGPSSEGPSFPGLDPDGPQEIQARVSSRGSVARVSTRMSSVSPGGVVLRASTIYTPAGRPPVQDLPRPVQPEVPTPATEAARNAVAAAASVVWPGNWCGQGRGREQAAARGGSVPGAQDVSQVDNNFWV